MNISSFTDRLFHCITTHPCGETREMLQAGIETWKYMFIHTHTHTHTNIYIYIYISGRLTERQAE